MEDRFTSFSLPHFLLLSAIVALGAGLALWSRKSHSRIRATRVGLGAILLVNELAWYWYYVHADWFVFPYTLPLQLCDILIWVAVVTLFTANRRAYELLYFWGLTGTSMALLTPDVNSPAFSYLTLRFFVSHGGIIIAVMVLTWGNVQRPQRGSAWRAFLALHIYGALVLLFNSLFGTNYFYLSEKPAEVSLLDYMGPWPVYILVGDLLAVALFWLLWLPWRKNPSVSTSDGSAT